MADNILVNGIIISSMPIGEYDKRIVILTKELGKISAFVRRARRPKSSLLGVSNAFIYGQLELYRGSSYYSVSRINATEYFTHITSDIDNMMLGTYILEVADYYAEENNDERERLLLIYRTLQVIGAGKMSLELIRCIYEFRTMVINGVYPNLYECSECHGNDSLVALSPNLEGIVCSDCYNKIDNSNYLTIKSATLYTLQYVASSAIKKLYSFELTEDIETEFIHTVEILRKRYLNYDFKSALFLKI